MKILFKESVKFKSLLIFSILFLIVLISGTVIFSAIHQTRQDSEITNALGRQRMLVLRMEKTAFAVTMGKGIRQSFEHQVDQLNAYITTMRKIYTETVVEPMESAGIKISMEPSNPHHNYVPFPATFTRMVNEKFQTDRDLAVEILAESPVNPLQILKSDLDREANSFLQENPDSLFSRVSEQGGVLKFYLYTADRATTERCVTCHVAIQNRDIKNGDVLGIRKFSLVYSKNIVIGQAELNASLEEFNEDKLIFGRTLSAVQKGGVMTTGAEWDTDGIVAPVENQMFQRQARLVEEDFKNFTDSIDFLLSLPVNTPKFREIRQEVERLSDRLIQESDQLVENFVGLAGGELERIQIAVLTSAMFTLLVLVGIYFQLNSKILTPVAQAEDVLSSLAEGNLRQDPLPVESKDEVGGLGLSLNQLSDNLRRFIEGTEGILAGETRFHSTHLKNDFKTALKKILVQENEKKNSREELERAHASLESRVRERTSELLQTNATLEEEIVKRETAEVALRGTNEFLENILESPHDISIISTDLDGNILYWNIGAENLLGYSAEEMVGKRKIDHIYPEEGDSRKTIKKAFSAIKSTKRGVAGEIKEITKDGREIWVKLTISPRLDSNGEIIGLLGIGENVSQRKEAEKDLRDSEERFRMILNTAYHSFVSTDAQGCVREWNAQAEQLFGWKKEEVIGQVFSRVFVSKNFVVQIDSALRDYVQKKSGDFFNRSMEVMLKNRQGREFPAEIIITPLIRKEEITFNAFIEDISERKRDQAQLTHAQKMESIGQLAAGIGHEINSPLQYIGDNTRFLQHSWSKVLELLKEYQAVVGGLENGSPEEESLKRLYRMAEECDLEFLSQEIPLAIEQSLDGVHRVSKIVMAMKEFSHPGGQEKKSLDLNRAIQTTLDISRNAWKYMADVVTRFDPDLPPVPCFSDEFNQVILNLVVNAAQAMADKGKENENVKGTITITTRSDKGWVEILIEDDGGGIPEEIQTKIFDPFFTTKPVGVGTGQGLSIVHSIVTKQHQGTITFSSQVNRGTTFCVRLPIHPEK